MKAFIKTLFGDTWNIAGVAMIVGVAVILVGIGQADLAVYMTPAAALAVVAALARH
jgi:hypothetical protein